MNDISAVRLEAKRSMQAMIDKALVQDEWSRLRKILLYKARIRLYMGITLPIAFLMVGSIVYHSKLHDGYNAAFSTFMNRHGMSYRRIYSPEIFEKEKRVRPYESLQFQ